MQHSGLIPGLNLTGFGQSEKEIANNLGTVWFVPYANLHPGSKGNKYPYVFLKPTSDIKERFSFRSEILCIFHPFSTIDARLFEAIEKIISSNPLRLDRLCVVLVTKATEIRKEDLHRGSDSDLRIIIPFRYSDLSGGAGGKQQVTISALEKHLYTTNLFAISSALQTDRYFYGRKAEIQDLVRKYHNCENSSLFGLRRIGKTSLLWALTRELKATQTPITLIDCSDPSYHKSDWNRALYLIKEKLCTTNGLAKIGHPEANYTEENASICFTEDLKQIKHKTGKPALLIFDEIENLCFDLSPSEKWKNGNNFLPFWQTIRSTFQQNPNLLCFLLCGVNPYILERSRLENGTDNPLYEYIKPVYLGFFSFEDVETMLTNIGSYMGVTFEPQVFTYLTDDFGGHPFLIRQACSRIWKKISTDATPRKVSIKKATYLSMRDDLDTNARTYINLILEVLTERYPNEYGLLKYIAAGDHERVAHVQAQSAEYLEHLIGYGLIEHDGQRFHFRIMAVENAIKTEARELVCPDAIEERWATLSRERNSFEHELREIVRQQIKLKFGKTEGKAKILEVMTKQAQKEKFTNSSYDEVFRGELYFVNLRDAVLKNWELFKFIFNDNKGRFSSSMDIANKYRADAHAKSITKDQFREVMPHLVWLSNNLSENT